MFDKSVAGLASQGFERSSDEIACLYRSGARRCAYGWILPDNILDRLERDGSLSCAVPSLFKIYADAELPGYDDGEFIADLQRTHDNAYFAGHMKSNLRELAARYNLAVPSVLTV
jgi:hypothetical protein